MSNSSQSTPLPFVPRYRISASSSLLIALANFLALIALRFDLFTDFSTHIIGGFSGDGGLYYWLFRHNTERFFSTPWFNTNILYPYSQTLAWSDNFIFPSMIGKFLLLVGCETIVAYNLVIAGAMALNGICTSRLAFHLCGDLFSSIFAGVLFMGSAYLSSVVGHPQLQFAFFLPLVIDRFFSYFYDRKNSNALRLGICITLAFLTTVYFALFAVVSCAVLLIGIFFLRPRALSPLDLIRLALFSLAGALPLLLFVPPYLDVQATFGERHLYEPYFFSASILSFFSSSSQSLLYAWTSGWSAEEAHLFVGVFPLLLILALLARLKGTRSLNFSGIIALTAFALTAVGSSFGRVRIAELGTILTSYVALCAATAYLILLGRAERALGASYITTRSLIALFLYVGLVFFLVALGPLGNPAEGFIAPGIYRIFYDVVPGFDSLRAISRVAVLSLLAISILSALALTSLQRIKMIDPRWFLIAYVLLAAENMISPHIKEPLPSNPTVLKMLSSHANTNTAAIVLPYSGALKENGEIKSWKEFAKINVTAMNWALEAGVPTINGYSGQQTKIMKELPRELIDFPSNRSIRALREFAGLKFVLYASRLDANFNRETFERRQESFADRLRLLEVDSDGNYLFELIGGQTLDSHFSLLVPSFPPRHLNVQIKTRKSGNNPKLVLPVMIHGLYEKFPYFNITVKNDGEFHWYSLPLPPTTDYVRPQRLYFSGGDTAQMILGEVALVSDEGSD